MVVFKSHWEDVSIPQNVGFTDYLLEKMALHSGKVATIESETGETTKYEEFQRQILATASALHRRGFQKNDVMAVLSTNNAGFSLISLASIHLGGAVVGVNIKYTIEDMLQQFDVCKPTFLAFSKDFEREAIAIQNKYQILKKVYIIGPATNSHESVNDLAKEKIELPEITRDPKNDIAFYFFSSGTTGLPKGVPATHYQMLASILRHGSGDTQLIPDDHVFGLITPMYHIISVGISSISCWCQGNTVVFFQNLNFPRLLAGIEQFRVNSLIVVSTMANSFAYDPIVDNFDLSSLKMYTFTAAPASEEVLNSMKKRLNNPLIRIAYGMTEVLAIVHLTALQDANKIYKRGSVGRLLPNTLCKVFDFETLTELGRNEKGEILIKCESIMSGYVGNPEATKAGFVDDGWWRTGDFGFVDDEENLFVLDRLKDMIKVYGEQVSPSALEDILLKHDAVSEVSVIGVPDKDLGEVPKAFVVLKSAGNVSEEELSKYVNCRVADFQTLKGGVEFIDSIPKNAMNKVLRAQLRKRST